jgi:2'-5' RNA ligase
VPPARDAVPGSRLRLFVALELPGTALDALEAFRDAELALTGDVWRAVPRANLHLTLAFLGWREEAEVAVVAAALGSLGAVAAPPLALAGALLLPPRRSRVLCAAVTGEAAPLQARVSRALVEAGAFEPEARPFRAHATVARLRSGARATRSVVSAPEPVAFLPEAVTLFRSRPGPGGSVYVPLSRHALVAPP